MTDQPARSASTLALGCAFAAVGVLLLLHELEVLTLRWSVLGPLVVVVVGVALLVTGLSRSRTQRTP